MFAFPEACGGGANSYRGWGILKSWVNRYRDGGVSEFSVIFPNDGADMFNRESVRENSWVVCRKAAISQLYSGCCSRRVMAALCSRRGAPETACSHRDHHVRRVAGVVATEKARIEGNIYTVRKPDYTAEEWRLLYLTTSVDLYLHSIRLVGFCGFGDIKWAMVTRMKEENNLPRERYYEIFSKESYPVLHYMRPQFRFLVFFGRINPRINLAHNEDRFFYDMKKVVNGDVSVWGEPVVVDGVPLVPEVECLVPSWLQQEYFARTAHLGLPAGQHYVYPGVRSPLLLPTDYIRKYIFFFPYVDSFSPITGMRSSSDWLFLSYSCGSDVG